MWVSDQVVLTFLLALGSLVLCIETAFAEMALSPDERQERLFGWRDSETVAETEVIVKFWEFDGGRFFLIENEVGECFLCILEKISE
jgi:hypothetical protein